jgi:tetratricopeptide (TPR) repeat protein
MTWRARPLEKKLPEEALRHFVKALQTDRMVTVVGSMATRGLGYPSWPEFCQTVAEIARRLVARIKSGRRHEPRIDTGDEAALHLLNLISEYADNIDRAITSKSRHIDRRVALWQLYDAFAMLDSHMLSERSGLVSSAQYQQPALELFERLIARLFEGRTTIRSQREPSPVHQLIAALGIKRYVTLNYDFELEVALMLRPDERAFLKAAGATASAPEVSRVELFADMAWQLFNERHSPGEEGIIRSFMSFVGSEGSGKPIIRKTPHILERRMTNGMLVESNIVDRARPDRLLEFSVGSSEVDRHILHLHGRADAPESLVAHIRHYNRLYRLDDLYRDPFDYGLKVLFGGNPILFVGVGMNEHEVNQTLEYFVSNSPIRRPAPLFLLWTVSHITCPETRKTYMRGRRIDWWSRLGVRVIFDADLTPERDCDSTGVASVSDDLDGVQPSSPEVMPPIAGSEAAHAPTANATSTSPDSKPADIVSSSPKDDDEAAQRSALVQMMAKLPELVARIAKRQARREWDLATQNSAPIELPTHRSQPQPSPVSSTRQAVWRSLRARLEQPVPVLPFRLWGTVSLMEFATGEAEDKEPLARSASQAAPKSRVLFAYADVGYGRGKLAELIGRMPKGVHELGGVNLLSTDEADRLVIHAGFSYDSDAMLNGIAHFLRLRAWDQTNEVEEPMCRERHFADGSLFNTKAPTLIIINGADRFFGLNGMPLSAELDHMIRAALRCGGDVDVQFLLLGTQRIRPYAQLLGQTLHELDPKRRLPRKPSGPYQIRELALHNRFLDSQYLEWVATKFADKRRKIVRANRVAWKEMGTERRLEYFRRTDITPASAAVIGRAIDHDRDAVFRAFFSAYLSPLLLERLEILCPETFEILRTLSFIGGPIEASVLLHAPKVWAMLSENANLTDATGKNLSGTDMRNDEEVICDRFVRVIEDLLDLGLVLEVDPHQPVPLKRGSERKADSVLPAEGDPETALADGPKQRTARDILLMRVGLHRSLATYLRDQHGAPINDAKLATTFNMTLFMSEQADNYTPEPSFHQEIGNLVDSLIGAWHDVQRFHGTACREKLDERLQALPIEKVRRSPHLSDLYVHHEDEEHAGGSIYGRSSREAAACLRAALLLVRGYFSTGTLLKLDTQTERHSDRDGALTEHAARIDRMLDCFGNIAVARTIYREVAGCDASDAKESKARRLLIDDHVGAAPFYADDLIWLLNERGVIALAQGQLYEARDAFSLARNLNSAEVETDGYFGHNARRIAINLVGTQLERGNPKAATKLLDKIDLSITTAAWCALQRAAEDEECAPKLDRVSAIREMFSETEIDPPVQGTKDFTREEMMVVGMTTGYRGLVAQLRGKYHEASLLYESAIRILRGLGEQRAQAHFERHRATLHGFLNTKSDEGLAIAQKAMTVAQAARQMDILHRTRIVWANFSYQTAKTAEERSTAIENIKQALQYAAQSDCYRVRIEASARLARLMRKGGDNDAALRYAADALMTASRYGHSNQKTAMRIEIGKILQRRGDPLSAEALFERANEIAVGKGNSVALEQVRRARSAWESR